MTTHYPPQQKITDSMRKRYALAVSRGHMDMFIRPVVESIYSFSHEELKELEKEVIHKQPTKT